MLEPAPRLGRPGPGLGPAPVASFRARRTKPAGEEGGDPVGPRLPGEAPAVLERPRGKAGGKVPVALQRPEAGQQPIQAIRVAEVGVVTVAQDFRDIGGISGENRPARGHVKVELQRQDRGSEVGQRRPGRRDQQDVRGEDIVHDLIGRLPGNHPDVGYRTGPPLDRAIPLRADQNELDIGQVAGRLDDEVQSLLVVHPSRIDDGRAVHGNADVTLCRLKRKTGLQELWLVAIVDAHQFFRRDSRVPDIFFWYSRSGKC